MAGELGRLIHRSLCHTSRNLLAVELYLESDIAAAPILARSSHARRDEVFEFVDVKRSDEQQSADMTGVHKSLRLRSRHGILDRGR